MWAYINTDNCMRIIKIAELNVENWPKQVLGYLPLACALPDLGRVSNITNGRALAPCTWPEQRLSYLPLPFVLLARRQYGLFLPLQTSGEHG
jgi:hypothetical protein